MENSQEINQIRKRVDWLEKEHRDDKTTIAAFQSKLGNLETENSALRLRLAEVDSGLTRMNTLMARCEQVEKDVNATRSDLSRQVEELKGSVQEKQVQLERNLQKTADLAEEFTEQQKKQQLLEGLSNELETRKEEDTRLARLIEELRAQVSEIEHFDEDYKQSIRMIEENRRQDSKRLTDFQGEISSLRKRMEETRTQQDLSSDSLRKLESQVKDLINAESEKREAQSAFIDKANLAKIEQERTFKQWSERFDKIEKVTDKLDKELTGLENTHQSVKKSQATLDEVSQRFERRINEITEVQRLNEDRFRQEWTTYKSDDQKRWSNYIIAQDEQHREMNRSIESLSSQISTLTEAFELVQENIQELGRIDIKRMQIMLNSLRESIDTYTNIYKD